MQFISKQKIHLNHAHKSKNRASSYSKQIVYFNNVSLGFNGLKSEEIYHREET